MSDERPPENAPDPDEPTAAPTPAASGGEDPSAPPPPPPPEEEPPASAPTPAASGGEAPGGEEPPPAPPADPEPPAEASAKPEAPAEPQPPQEEPPAPAAAATPAASGGEAPPQTDAPATEDEPPQTAPTPAASGGEDPSAPPREPAAKPRPKRPPRPREPLPWPELRAVAAMARETADVEELKELFRALPSEIRDETVEGVREYRKGARRPVSAHAGKSLARAVHTARRARRRPESDAAVSDALGQALAAEVIASLDVEVAAEVILPKRDLLDRESRNARRRQKVEDERTRDEKRRRAREESNQQGTRDGAYSGAKIRGLDELAKLFPGDDKR